MMQPIVQVSTIGGQWQMCTSARSLSASGLPRCAQQGSHSINMSQVTISADSCRTAAAGLPPFLV